MLSEMYALPMISASLRVRANGGMPKGCGRAAVAGPKVPGKQFDSSCFSGEYVTGAEAGYFEHLRQLRSDDAKRKRRGA